MTPVGMGTRSSVELYEVAVMDLRLPAVTLKATFGDRGRAIAAG